MQTEKRVNVQDIRDLIKFWEMKEEIKKALTLYHHIGQLHHSDDLSLLELIIKIESIGKKEIGK